MKSLVTLCLGTSLGLYLLWVFLFSQMLLNPVYVVVRNGVAYNYVIIGYEEPWIATLELIFFVGLASATAYTLTRLWREK